MVNPDLATTGLRPLYSFEHLVIGPNNQVAAAACHEVVRSSGEAHNPLFLFGSAGVGKTHLMQAVARGVLGDNPSAQIRYVSAERFASDVLTAMTEDRLRDFRESYALLDLLILDDIQYLGESKVSQEEFFHIFNRLHQARHQIILAADRAPHQLLTLTDGVRSRLQWGLAVEVRAPDEATRVEILKLKQAQQNLQMSDEMLVYAAKAFTSNVRELEGFLKRMYAHVHLSHEELTMELVESVVNEVLPKGPSLAEAAEQISFPPASAIDESMPSLRRPAVNEAVPPPAPVPFPEPELAQEPPSAPAVSSAPVDAEAPFQSLNSFLDSIHLETPTMPGASSSDFLVEEDVSIHLPSTIHALELEADLPSESPPSSDGAKPEAKAAGLPAPGVDTPAAPVVKTPPLEEPAAPPAPTSIEVPLVPEEPSGSATAQKEVGAVFFYPEGNEDALESAYQKFQDVIRKHKLKFRLRRAASQPYPMKGKVNFGLFVDACKASKVPVAVVIGPPPASSVAEHDFYDLLTVTLEVQGISLQLIQWSEITKDYRYLNLALDIALVRSR